MMNVPLFCAYGCVCVLSTKASAPCETTWSGILGTKRSNWARMASDMEKRVVDKEMRLGWGNVGEYGTQGFFGNLIKGFEIFRECFLVPLCSLVGIDGELVGFGDR